MVELDCESNEYVAGWVAGISFVPKEHNPHKPMSLQWKNWNHGWHDGKAPQA